MKHIIVQTNFDLNQQVLVYIDGECKEIASASVDNLVNVVNSLRLKYNINNIDLFGNKQYVRKMQEDLISKYSELNITVIER